MQVQRDILLGWDRALVIIKQVENSEVIFDVKSDPRQKLQIFSTNYSMSKCDWKPSVFQREGEINPVENKGNLVYLMDPNEELEKPGN